MTGGRAAAAEGELAQRELLLGEAERIVHLGSWMWTPDTNAIRWSDEMFRILGYEPGAVVPTVEAFFGAIHPEDRGEVEAVAARGVASRAPEPVDFRLLRRDATVRYVHMEGAVAEQAGSLCIVGTVLDVTEKREVADRLARAEKIDAIGSLASGLAHDFNNYLQVIVGHARVLATNPSLDARAASSVEQIAVAAGRCDRLTRELLSFARRSTINRARVDLPALVTRALPLMESLLGPSVRVEHRLNNDGPLLIEADEASLEQALMNLATNARDAMPSGGTLTLTTAATTEGAERGVCLTVRDDGCGMSPSVAQRVFEPFYSTKPSGQGTGLGLASVLGLVEQMGGTIRVESEEGRGTAFHLCFPRLSEAQGAVDARQARGLVLVVEDQDAIRGLVRDALDLAGYRVWEARDGVEALARLADNPQIELVVTDVSMPRMSGTELIAAAARPGAPPAFLLMTGVLDPQLDELDAAVLRKPFSEADLLRAVQARLAHARVPR